MAEGFWQVMKIILAIAFAIALITMIYFLKDVLFEKTAMIKDIFSGMFG